MDIYLKTLKEHFKFDSFRDKQLEIIKTILEEKRDVCAIMFTGAGKSLCYQFPPVFTNKTCLIISPLISLMKDQQGKMENVDVPVCCLNSTIQFKNDLKMEILENKYRLVYMAPEYLITQKNFLNQLIENEIIQAFCIDEAHCISTWGSDFREAYKKLDCLRLWFPNIPIMTFTATATKKVQNDIINILKLKNPLIIKTTFNRPNLIIRVFPKKENPINDLLPLIKKNEQTIIYCQTRKMTDQISKSLKTNNILCGNYHAGMSSEKRSKIHQKFSSNKISCIVATIAFGMGIDAIIRKVIHYGIPKDMESYYQEIGRAGRDGEKSECILFYALSDMNSNNYFLNKIKNIAYRNHMVQLALVMKNYIFSSECRRKYILEYFDEKYQLNNCEACDNCFKNKKIIKKNFSEEAIKVFRILNLTGNIYGRIMIINILRGSNSKKIPTTFKKSNLFASGKNHSEQWWKIFLTLLINGQFIKEKPISGGHAFSLGLTTQTMDWIKSFEKNKETTLLLQVPEEMEKLILPTPKKKIIDLSLSFDDETDPDNNLNDNFDEKNELEIINKKSNIDLIFELFQIKKKNIDQIANQLNLKKLTIENNLVKLFDQNKYLDLDRLNFNNEVFDLISKKIIQLNYPDELKQIKKSLPNYISYLQIKLTQIKMNKNKGQINKNKVNDIMLKINQDIKFMQQQSNTNVNINKQYEEIMNSYNKYISL